MDAHIQRIVDLVHRRDDLLKRRAQLTEDIDREISAIEAQLVSERTPVGTSLAPSNAVIAAAAATGAVTVKAGSHAEKILKLVAKEGRLPPIGELATFIYGEDTKTTRHNLGAVLWGLRKTGRLPPSATTSVEVNSA